MPDVFKIAQTFVDHATETHPGEIAIVAYYGSYAKGTDSPTSDLDLFYIPDKGKAHSLSSQFIIDGLPYDFWPLSWEFATSIANAQDERDWAVSASLLADAKVLYQRSPADLARFEALQTRIQTLTQPESRAEMTTRALAAFKSVCFQHNQMELAATKNDRSSMRWAAHKFVNGVFNCLALLNQRYLSKGWGGNWQEALDLEIKPAGLADNAAIIVSDQDTNTILQAATTLRNTLRKTLSSAQQADAKPGTAQAVFKDFYFFVFEYKNKVLSACSRGDQNKANYAAFQLQEEISQLLHKVAHGFYGNDFNLLGEYSDAYQKANFPDLLEAATQGDLKTLAQRVRILDEKVRAWLEERGVALNILGDEEGLRNFLKQRDPQ